MNAAGRRRVILVLIEPPLPFGNAAGRWFYVLYKGLLERGQDVTVFSTCSKPEEAEEARRLFPSPEHDLRIFQEAPGQGGIRSKIASFQEPYSYVFGPGLRAALKAELQRGFDVLHLEQLWSGWLGRRYASRAVLNIHYAFAVDLAGRPPVSMADRILKVRTAQAERALLRSYPWISTLSPRLTEWVRGLSPQAAVETVPLGIDSGLYEFRTPRPAEGPPTLGLIGSFSWQPTYSSGVRLIGTLWPEIRRQVPGCRLQVVGRQARHRLASLTDDPSVTFHEDVPDTIPYFRSTDALLYAPSAGSGMKVKVLESFGLGTPVVTNADGVEGIPAVDGVHAGIAEDDAGLIERAVTLLRDPARRASQAREARALLESHCSPQVTVDAAVAFHDRIIEAARNGAVGGGRR